MIKLFNAAATTFTSNGDVVLMPTKARVFNSDNGDYYLDLTCNTDFSDYLTPNNIIVVPTPQGEQAFRIRTVTKSKKKIEVKAYHIFYDSLNYLIVDSYAVNMTAEQALNHFNNATDTESPFTMVSDVTIVNNQREVRASLFECVNDVIERWGGHLKRDNWTISLLSNIGVDNGVTIEYRKNLQELAAEYDFTNVVTKLLPVGKDGILLNDLWVYSAIQYDTPFSKSVSFEQDINREDYQTEEEYIAALKTDLLEQATDYVTANSLPIVNYTLKANPERVTDIGDIIEVKDERIGVNVLTEVISYEYDAIQEKYVNLEFGNFTTSLSDLMTDIKINTNMQITQATSNINIEVSEITADVNRLKTSKQDKLTEGQYIQIIDDVIGCTLEDGDGVEIGTDNKINLAPITSYTFKDIKPVVIDTNVLTFYAILPRPIESYNISGFDLKIYETQLTTIDIDETTTDITITSEEINSYTLKVTITDAGSTLSNLTGVYNAEIELNLITP